MPNGPLDKPQDDTKKDDAHEEDVLTGIAKQFVKGFKAGKKASNHQGADDKNKK